MATKDIKQKVTIDTGQSEAEIRKVEDAAKDADKAISEVDESEISVDTEAALRRLGEIDRELRDLKDEKVSLKAELDASGFSADVGKVKGDLSELSNKAEATGKDVRGLGGEKSVSAIRDLSGPLGEVSSAVGDFGDSFVAAADVIGTQMGLSEEAVGKLATFLGPAGIAAGAVFYFWNVFQQNAEKARQKVKEVEDAQRALASLQYGDAATKILEGIGDAAVDAAERIGISTEDIVGYVTGARDSISGLTDLRDDEAKALDTVNRLIKEQGLTYNEALAVVNKAIEGVEGYKDTWQETNSTLKEADRRQFEALKALGATKEAFLDLAEKALPETRRKVLDYVLATEKIPKDVVTKISALPDTQKVEATRQVLDAVAADRKAGIEPFVSNESEAKRVLEELTRPRSVTLTVNWRNTQGRIGGVDGPGIGGSSQSSGANYTINVQAAPLADPASIGKEVVRAIQSYERLAGSTWRAV